MERNQITELRTYSKRIESTKIIQNGQFYKVVSLDSS